LCTLSRWADMTALSKDDVTVQRARGILQQWRELLGGGSAQGVWPEIDRLFQQQKMQPWTAAQFFLHQASSAPSSAGGEGGSGCEDRSAMLKVRTQCPAPALAALKADLHVPP